MNIRITRPGSNSGARGWFMTSAGPSFSDGERITGPLRQHIIDIRRNTTYSRSTRIRQANYAVRENQSRLMERATREQVGAESLAGNAINNGQNFIRDRMEPPVVGPNSLGRTNAPSGMTNTSGTAAALYHSPRANILEAGVRGTPVSNSNRGSWDMRQDVAPNSNPNQWRMDRDNR